MKRSLQYLRIAFSATCIVACVLLIVLWVRSYWRFDKYSCQNLYSPIINCSSMAGRVLIEKADVVPGPAWPWGWHAYPRFLHGGHTWELLMIENVSRKQFLARSVRDGYVVVFPHWSLILVSGVLATTPWMHWRFSLRTLLIATTVLSVVLGLAVYVARQ